MVNIPKGTKDVLPNESYLWQYVESSAREVCRLFGAREIRTPVFEHTELFLRSIGDTTDVVNKEMYTFEDKGGRSLTLKPEGTAGVARSYIENNLEALSLPLKMFYITPVFRYERPQAGRYREHHQFGVEFYGSPTPETDGEVISLAYMFLKKMGVTGLLLKINSIGCPTCRAQYNAALREYLAGRVGDMCENCRTRFEKNPLRILDCKVPTCKAIVADAPKIGDYLCDGCRAHMAALERYLKDAEIPYEVDCNIVRGLDYYTRTVFEFVTDALGSQGTVCGGGRYDGLVESVGGKPTPCVGFGMGLERLLLLMQTIGVEVPAPHVELFIAPQCEAARATVLRLARELRAANVAVDTDLLGRSVKSQLKYADKIGAKHVLVIGESELVDGTCRVKRMADGTTAEVAMQADALLAYITNESK